MDTPSTLLRPRLRLFRRSPSPPRVDDGSSDATPRSFFPALHDELDDEHPTPRIHPRPILDTTVATETPAARLRALLAREPRSPRPRTTPPPPPSSDTDSVAEPSRVGSSTSSVARDSLKDIFSRALREPGDTPQKGRPRRNSFDGSSMEITPVVHGDRGHRRAARRSLSDEEAEKPKSNRRVDPSFRLSNALTFDTLRARLVSSRSQLIVQNPPEALYDPSTSSHSQHLPEPSTSARVDPQASTLPSFQMSSQLASQSNLLDQDSEMQRAMGDILNSENEASTSVPNVAQPTAIQLDSRPSSSLRESKSGSKPEPGRTSHELDSSGTSSGATDRGHRSQQEGHNHQRERDWNRPRTPSRSSTPEVHRRHSQEFHRLSQELRSPSHIKSATHEFIISQSGAARPLQRQLQRRGSVASLRSFDEDDSSRPSSIGSQADYRDRISELDRERNYEREREWNKRYPPSRPSSSLSTSSNHSFSHSHSHPPRPPSVTPYLTPTHASLQRKSSRTSLRSDSPASLASSHDSLKERKQEEKKEVTHERERNWNSPRPHWSTSKSPPASHSKIRNNSLRGDSNGYGDPSRMSTKLQSTSPKTDPPSPVSPAFHKSRDRPNSSLGQNAIGTTQSAQLKSSSPGKAPGIVSKFGWNFARSPLPPLELDDRVDHRRSTSSPTPGSLRSTRASEAIVSSQIPVRSRMRNVSSPGHAASDMSLTHVVGDESSLQQDHQNGLSDPQGHGEPPGVRNSWGQENTVPGTNEESTVDFPPQSTTPKSNPPDLVSEEVGTDTDTEVLTSPSPQGSPQLGPSVSNPTEAFNQEVNDLPRAQTCRSPDKILANATPPGTPPSTSPRPQLSTPETPPSFALVTPPRGTPYGSSILDFQTPSPPHDLPDLPGPPSSSDDDALGGTPARDGRASANLNFTLTKTPKPPGAWATTPLLPKFGHRSSSPSAFFPLESTPPASTSTPLPRTNSHPRARIDTATDDPSEDPSEDGPLTPVGTLPRARSLPSRTPVPPGAWVATPGQSALLSNGADQSQYGSLGRKKGLLRVRFDVAESETSATEGHSNSPLSAIRLANSELPLPKSITNQGTDANIESIVNEDPQPTTSALLHRPTTPERAPTTIVRENVPSPRSLRKSPSVRLVDAYGRERIEEAGTEKSLMNGRADAERKITPSPPTPRRSLVRVVDAMGREVDDSMGTPDMSKGTFDADMSIILDGSPIGHAEALARMRKTLRDLAESLSDTDRSDDLELNSSHMEQLEEVSKAARVARNQLAHNLHLETEKEHDLRLHSKSESSTRTRDIPPAITKKFRSTTIIYFGVIIQLLVVLAMWRYAHTEAHRLFYTTYYDPLYPELTPMQESSCFSGTLSTSRPWTMLDSYETIRREGWSTIREEMLRAMRHVGDQVWERWGEKVHFEKPT